MHGRISSDKLFNVHLVFTLRKVFFAMMLADRQYRDLLLDMSFTMTGLLKCAEEYFHHGSYQLCCSVYCVLKFPTFHLNHLLWECVCLLSCAVGFSEAGEKNRRMGRVQRKPLSCLLRGTDDFSLSWLTTDMCVCCLTS